MEIKVVWCGNCTWDQVEEELNFCLWKGHIVVLVGVDINKQDNFFMRLSEWFRSSLEKVEDYLAAQKISEEFLYPKGSSCFEFVSNKIQLFRNFRLVATCNNKSYISDGFDEISYKWADEQLQDPKEQYCVVLSSEVDESDFSRPENIVWRRAIANMIFFYVLVKQRDALGTRGFIKKVNMNMSDIRLILTYLRSAIKCYWSPSDHFLIEIAEENLDSENKLKQSDT
jgi:hypothetical protein